ncbi:hypothetical protein [Sphingomonas sp.]|uniref:hypothetical protein n=1 Tax=Sphingomonas sp. TaxID=28214 RepID=UPI00286D0193|nr:hypothetical protein [Sphingomonas sp.]
MLGKFLAGYLLITGIGAFVALSAPGLVVLGFFLLLIPGLILSLMPTAFLYGVVFAAGWYGARALLGDGVIAIVGGVAAIAIVATLTVLPRRMIDLAAYHATIQPDVRPASPIALKGNVRFNRQQANLNEASEQVYPYVVGTRGYACDSFCLAALFTPGVTSVTIDQTREADKIADGRPSPEARTYRLAPRPNCQSNVDMNFRGMQPPLRNKGSHGISDYEDGKVLAAQWALKLASDFCLVAEPARIAHDIVITERETDNATARKKWSFGPGRISTQTIEIAERGKIVYRNHQSSVNTLDKILTIAGTGGIENFGFDWARTTINSKTGYDAVKLADSLGDFTTLAGRPEVGISKNKAAMLPPLRAQIRQALDAGTLDERSPAFQVLEAYFAAVGDKATDEDVAITSRLAADPRLKSLPGIWSLKLTLAQARIVYDAYTKRLLANDPADAPKKSVFNAVLKGLGPDAISLIGADQKRLLDDPVRRLAAPELVRTLGYGNIDQAWQLFAILKQTAATLADIRTQRENGTIGSYGRQDERDVNGDMISFVKSGFCLGAPKDKRLLGELDVFLKSGGSYAMTDWNVTMVRMGKAIDTVEKPEDTSGTLSNYQRNVQSKVDHWTPDRC